MSAVLLAQNLSWLLALDVLKPRCLQEGPEQASCAHGCMHRPLQVCAHGAHLLEFHCAVADLQGRSVWLVLHPGLCGQQLKHVLHVNECLGHLQG